MNLSRLLLLLAFLIPVSGFAEEPKPDDVISVNLSTEGWVQAKAARVQVSVNAAVMGDGKSGSTRDAMIKAVGELASKTEWRLTSFNRGQDPTGLEQWSAIFETRLPEGELGGIQQKAKTASKAGMQIAIINIDFTPSLAEVEAVRAEIRKTLMAMANKELEGINATYPDRKYRIAAIGFGGAMPMQPQVMHMMKRGMAMMADAAPAMEGVVNSSGGVETSQKIDMTANVTYAAIAPTSQNTSPAVK